MLTLPHNTNARQDYKKMVCFHLKTGKEVAQLIHNPMFSRCDVIVVPRIPRQDGLAILPEELMRFVHQILRD